MESGLEVEFTRSGPKRGPVYSFQSIEILASACAEFSPMPIAFDAPEALGQFADAIWHFRVGHIMPGYSVVPIPPTQGEASVKDTLEMAVLAVGLMETAAKLRFDSGPGEPFSVHYLSREFGIAWIATESEIAVARLHGPRSVMALGPSRDLAHDLD